MIQPMLCFRMLLGHFYQLLLLFLILWANRSFPQHFGHTISCQDGHGFKTPLIISHHSSFRIMGNLWPLGHLYLPRSMKNISRNRPWKISGLDLACTATRKLSQRFWNAGSRWPRQMLYALQKRLMTIQQLLNPWQN